MEQTALKPKAIVEGVEEIQKYMPHRFENVLLDKAETFDDNEEKLLAHLELTLAEGDAVGRDIFLVKNQKGELVYNAHMFPENLALGALVYLNTIRGDGYAALFSTISNFSKTGDIKAGETMSASIYLKRGKGAFQTFQGKVFNKNTGELVAETDVMAFVYKLSEAIQQGDAEKKKVDVPQKTINEKVDFLKINNKNGFMFFVEKLVHYNPEDNTAITSFKYPADHPFVKGHFPGNPIMMGVCQWMSMGDALDALALKLKAEGKVGEAFTLSADVDLLKEDGVLVSESREIVKSYIAEGDRLKPSTLSTKKCGFRDMVVPGDVIFQRLSNVVIS